MSVQLLYILVHYYTLYTILIHTIILAADPAGCGRGFMSVESVRSLLGLEGVGIAVQRHRRQQITPDINFTCDGMITKWIVGAGWDSSDSLYPELQVWRNIGNDVYQKINGTFINITTESSNRIYEFDNFSPIPFLPGDILGVFIPRNRDSKLRLRAEDGRGPLNYFIRTLNNATVSPYATIDIESNIPPYTIRTYHPLVTIEISKFIIIISDEYSHAVQGL